MHRRQIKTMDLTGNEVLKEYYFHLAPGQLIELELTTPGGIKSIFKNFDPEKDPQYIVDTFKTLLAMTAGKRVNDEFVRMPDFVLTDAYSSLLVELITKPGEAEKFVNAIMPPEMIQRTERQVNEFRNSGTNPGKTPSPAPSTDPAPAPAPELPTSPPVVDTPSEDTKLQRPDGVSDEAWESYQKFLETRDTQQS